MPDPSTATATTQRPLAVSKPRPWPAVASGGEGALSEAKPGAPVSPGAREGCSPRPGPLESATQGRPRSTSPRPEHAGGSRGPRRGRRFRRRLRRSPASRRSRLRVLELCGHDLRELTPRALEPFSIHEEGRRGVHAGPPGPGDVGENALTKAAL